MKLNNVKYINEMKPKIDQAVTKSKKEKTLKNVKSIEKSLSIIKLDYALAKIRQILQKMKFMNSGHRIYWLFSKKQAYLEDYPHLSCLHARKAPFMPQA